jgi:CPA2 family monovalent cation:H+ antiporter-2
MDGHALANLLVYLTAAVVAVPLFRHFGLGAILGYLAAGAVIGPQVLHLIDDPVSALHFAEIGVVMLLFVIGLELDPEKLWNMRGQISILGGGQLCLSALLIAVFAHYVFDLNLQISVLIGLTLGLSSTAFAVQLMDEQGVMGNALGRKGFSILLFQDMAVIPILLLVSAWAPVADAGAEAHIPWWMGFMAIIAVLAVGRYAINPCLRLIAKSGNHEVLTAASLLIVIGTAVIMQTVGLSMGMGAFLAGIILANSKFRHQLEADIEPFKGLLLGLFFIAVGMTLDLSLLISKPLLIIGLAITLMIIKALIIAGLVCIRKSSFSDGFWLGLMLSQGGEFAFVVMTKSVSLALVDQSLADHLVLIVGISMALTSPVVMLFKRITSKKVDADTSDYDSETDSEPEVVVAGFGRFGQIVGRILAANHIHFSALDKDPSHVQFIRKFGHKIFFGDAFRLNLLVAAGLDHARVLVVAVNDKEEALSIVKKVKHAYPKVHIVARAIDREHVYHLKAAGADHIIREMLESSMIAARDTMILLGFTEGQALSKIDLFRQHDKALIETAVEASDDMDNILKDAADGRKELAQLFKQDESI